MRGRSKITFDNKSRRLLKGIGDDDTNDDLASRATWLRAAANCHTKLGNRFINLARTMKPSNNVATDMDRQLVTGKTLRAYVDLATKCSKKGTLTDDQKSSIKASWKGKREKNNKKAAPKDKLQTNWDDTFEEIQLFGKQIQELLELTEQCDLSNVIHSAKLTRCGEAHKQLAHQYFAKAKGEVEKAVKNRNSSGEDGGKHLAAAIGDQLGKPLMSVCRDQDTADGGKTGQMTSNPEDVDAIVKRAWQKIHEGAGGCIASAVDKFSNIYCGVISKKEPFEVERINGRHGSGLLQPNC